MAHFFTKHEMKKFDKKLTEENYLDTNRFKSQLKDEISKDNHRTNIDSAKKKAVVQCMNYDGFHQMVLGADLKGIKQGEIYSIGSNKTNTIMNNISTQNKFNDNIEILKNAFTVNDKEDKIHENLNSLKEKDFINQNDENIKYDNKFFIKEYKLINLNKNSSGGDNNAKEENEGKLNDILVKKLKLIRLFDGNFKEMLDEEKLPSDIFLDLINTIAEITKFFINNKENKEIFECFFYIKELFTGKFFGSLKIFIGKKQKNLYLDIIEMLNSYVSEVDNDDNENKFREIITFLKGYFK